MTRGLSLFNPGNIRLGAHWVGLALEQPDPDFCAFESITYGIRAMCRIFESYREDGMVTIADYINRWAPPAENNTSAYVSDVCMRMQLPSYHAVQISDYPSLVSAITFHEQGSCPLSPLDINQGVAMAIGE